ncbi:GntR family transcriptional regulator [Pelagibius litoralis]|uniref:GntR family transcriptional regulator n=1 Tax=Pelagibius litoralis TaxID=374515 RepID=UPI0019804813|nr:GntR family transcriptional regulator [Pelagibius litoralis]
MATQASTIPGFRPLYKQVKELLVERLIGGFWKPGDLLPSEFQLAAELGVSQGTVRKALDEMTADNLLVRRQGRGTFVAEHDQEHALFHFFKMTDREGQPLVPESRVLRRGLGTARKDEAARLQIQAEAPVIRITRVRSISGKPVIFERIALPYQLFPELHDGRELPNTLYTLFARDYGITVGKALERLRAVPASPEVARQLDLERDHPLLEIDRIALALDGRPVEWRISLCHTGDTAYSVTLA